MSPTECPSPARPWWRCLRPEEWLFVVFTAILALLVTFCHDHGWEVLGDAFRHALALARGREMGIFSTHLGLFGLLLGICLGVVAPVYAAGSALLSPDEGTSRASSVWRRVCRVEAKALQGARDYAPFVLCYVSYAMLRDIQPTLWPAVVDERLAAWERRWFGDIVARKVYLALNVGVLPAWLQWAYFSHFYGTPGIAFAYWIAGARERFRHLMVAISLASFLGWAGYLSMPALGPLFVFKDFHDQATYDDPTGFLALINANASRARDCFPSLHTAWSVILIVSLWRWRRWAAAAYAGVIGIPLMVACLFFGYHYLVDVAAGVPLALLAWWGAGRLEKAWG